MLLYCLKCRKNMQSKNPKVVKIKNGTIIFLSRCSVCKSKESKFINEQEVKGLLGNLLGAKIPILGDIPIVNTIF